MRNTIKILIILCALFFLSIALKTFFINNPPLSPELTANFYLQEEQFGTRDEAERFLFEDFNKVEILGEKYKDLKDVPYKKSQSAREFEAKEITFEKRNAKVNLIEKVLTRAYFFNFLLSEEYQKDGKIEFEVLLTKEGNWFSGYQWKVVKIESPTLIQSAKIGQEKEIKKGVFITTDNLTTNNLPQTTLKVIYKNQSGFKNQPGKEYQISFLEWEVVDQQGREFKPQYLEEKLESGNEKEVEFKFSLPEDFVLKEIVFRNEGVEIHFATN